MKKSLLALAVLGAFAGAAAAQTNVTMYGIADAGIGMADSDGLAGSSTADSAVTVFSGVQSTSRFGVRGSEDLGGGLKATFNIEAGVNWDTGAADSVFWQRRAVVGLASSWGEVRLGRDYTPGFLAGGVGDVMGYGLFGNWLTFTAQGTPTGYPTGVGVYGVTTRASNGLHYTGSFGGVTIRAMYATGSQGAEDYSGNNVGDMYGLSGVYAAGPLSVAAYWQQTDFGALGDGQQYGIGGQYNMGMFRVGLNYGAAEADNLADHTGWAVGVGMKVGSGEILAQYIQQELDNAAGSEAQSIGLAYVHPLSKRTNLYATYGQLDNKNGAQFGLRYSQSVVGAGAVDRDPKAFAVGIRHMF